MVFAVLFIGLISAGSASASNDCVQGHLVVDRQEQLSYSAQDHLSIRLPSFNIHGAFPTYAAFHWISPPDQPAAIFFDHVLPPPQNTGLPYNVYKIRLEIGDEASSELWTFEEDYTANCTEAGRSIYPGQSFQIPDLKIPLNQDGSSKEGEPLQIKIWGHL